MKGRLIVFTPGRFTPQTDRELENLSDRELLDVIQTAIGGRRERVPYWRSYVEPGSQQQVPCFAFRDKDGERKQLDANVTANFLCNEARRRDNALAFDGVLVGPVVVVIGDAEFLAAAR